MGNVRRRKIEGDVEPPAQHVGQQPAGAAVGDHAELDPLPHLDHGADQMPRPALARRPGHHLLGIGLGVSEEFLQRLRAELCIRHDGHRRGRHLDDRHQILVRIIGKVGDQELAVHDRCRRREQDRVPIRGRVGDHLGPDRAVRAGLEVDDDRSPEALAHALGQQARRRIGAAAREIGHDHRDWLCGPGALREGGTSRRRENRAKGGYHEFQASHVSSLIFIPARAPGSSGPRSIICWARIEAAARGSTPTGRA